MHPEVLLFSAFHSTQSSRDTRFEALQIILEARDYQRNNPSEIVRRFIYPKKPQINFDAEEVLDLLNWNGLPKSYITSPPILSDYSDEQLIQSCESNTLLDIPKIYSHNARCEE